MTIDTYRNVAETIFHITAKDEVRQFFPLTLAKKGRRIQMVGAHSDIGGGYMPNAKPGGGAFNIKEYQGVLDVLREKFGFSKVDETRALDTYKNQQGDTLFINYFSQARIPTSFAFFNKAEHGLQFVSLRLMLDEALAAGVPFKKSLGNNIDGINVALSDELQKYYEALSHSDTEAIEELEMHIRQRYAHMSFRNASIAGVVYAALPEKNGERRITIM